MIKNKIVVICFFLFMGSVTPIFTQTEKILSFTSIIQIHTDGSMIVTEQIRVHALGQQIKRGIYRDFPTEYKDKYGNRYRVGFKILEIKRDGEPEPYFTESQMNGIRIYIGNKNVFLQKGTYTYEIRYQTDRQLGFFKDHDELYWNVTGNGWDFPMHDVICNVYLPDTIADIDIKGEAFTGPQGSKEQAYYFKKGGKGKVMFRTTRPLKEREGLTIVVGWPKGYIQEPTQQKKLEYFISDNIKLLIGFMGILLLLLYYFVTWLKVGRDPAKGTIIPLFNPPENLSPASMRYIMKRDSDNKCFSSAIIDMAVKGYITIKNEDGKYSLHKTEVNENLLSSEERKISKDLLGNKKSIDIEQKNHSDIRMAMKSLKKNLEQNYFKKYFLKNSTYLIPGIVISALTLFFSVFIQSGNKDYGLIVGGVFICMWLAGWTTGVFFLLKQVLASWQSFFSNKKIGSLTTSLFMTAFSLPFLAGEGFGLFMLGYFSSIWTILTLILMIGITIVFYYLLQAPTLIGRKLMDKIEGFKIFLSVAEKDRLNFFNPPKKTPELFEKYLPYALALDVENNWAEQFTSILDVKDTSGGAPYHPVWYTGHIFSLSNMGSSIGSSFSSAISSSSVAPSSGSGFSSGGGGGSSGGGGGGGGGGGW